MINLKMKQGVPFDRNSISSINKATAQSILTSQNISSLNRASGQKAAHASRPQANIPHTPAAPAKRKMPVFTKPIQKGQKVALEDSCPLSSIKACFGWNTLNPQCDVDVSAFLLGANGKVIGDSWFIFYGQPKSPCQSCHLSAGNAPDCQSISIDFKKLNAGVNKIVFVLTINDAFAKKLHFGMIADAYIRILDAKHTELASFVMADYYSNVISMMIGELYRHNGKWKFSAVGNGVAKDLAGLCNLYGVQVSD